MDINIDIKVKKKSNKPFKSGNKVNIVNGVIKHPKVDELAFTFKEDDSYVSIYMCEPVNMDNDLFNKKIDDILSINLKN